MAPSVKTVVSRIAFLTCGIVALLLGNVLRSSRDLIPGTRGLWLSLAIVLLLAGLTSVLAGSFSASWLVRVFPFLAAPSQLTELPIRLLLCFAGFLYVLILGLTLVSPQGIAPFVTFILCPACALTVTVDPSFASVVLFLGPVNAAAYGALGTMIGVLVTLLKHPRF